jgi:methyl-accepting chemotaxis protein
LIPPLTLRAGFCSSTDSLGTKQLLSALLSFKRGDFKARLPTEWTGVAGKIADTFNDVIELNEKMAKELARASRVVGKEGKITQRASMPTAGGAWEELADSVNTLIDDMARPTSEIVRVIGAVANGDLSQTMTLEVDGRPLKGEFLRSVKLVNGMVGQLNSFASEVTRVAREVGVEGKLGGQANVPGAAGTWRDLTDNVNGLAANLTTQVRAIAEVSTAVTKGDLALHRRRGAGRAGRAQGQHQRDDPQPARDDAEEHRAGLAQDEPRALHADASGPERFDHGRADGSLRPRPARGRAAASSTSTPRTTASR